jgi:hypothetical protein
MLSFNEGKNKHVSEFQIIQLEQRGVGRRLETNGKYWKRY